MGVWLADGEVVDFGLIVKIRSDNGKVGVDKSTSISLSRPALCSLDLFQLRQVILEGCLLGGVHFSSETEG